MNWDPVTTFNLSLSATICALGIAGWARVKNALALFIGIAFGLFALSHRDGSRAGRVAGSAADPRARHGPHFRRDRGVQGCAFAEAAEGARPLRRI